MSRYQKGKTSLDLHEARDDGVWGCSGISWTIRKKSAPRSRQITTPTRRHSISTGRMLFLTSNQQSTEGSKKNTSSSSILTVTVISETANSRPEILLKVPVKVLPAAKQISQVVLTLYLVTTSCIERCTQ